MLPAFVKSKFAFFARESVAFLSLLALAVTSSRGKCFKGNKEGRDSTKPRGLMDKASAYGAEDCGFKSHRGWSFLPRPLNN